MYDIELISVTKTYPGADRPAVKDITFAVEKGDIVTLLGPSGCGKTTLLRTIAGFERPEEGCVKLAGKEVASDNDWVPPEKRGVGMVFQDYALFPHLDVYNNVGFGYKKKDKKVRIEEVLELVNLSGYEKRYPHELSGGEQQRVALARALTASPVVVLLDEPFSNLDAGLRVQMRLELKKIIKQAGTTAIFVSHDQKDALAISDQIIVLKDGLIQQKGSPREIYQYPENCFVASFVGRSNLLDGYMAADANYINTTLGTVPCSHTHGHSPGEEVKISIRPDALELDENGTIEGTIKELTYTGEAYDALVEVYSNGKKAELLAHIHPEMEIQIDDRVTFKILPDFVAVVRNK